MTIPVATINQKLNSFKFCRLPVKNILVEPARKVKNDFTKMGVVDRP